MKRKWSPLHHHSEASGWGQVSHKHPELNHSRSSANSRHYWSLQTLSWSEHFKTGTAVTFPTTNLHLAVLTSAPAPVLRIQGTLLVLSTQSRACYSTQLGALNKGFRISHSCDLIRSSKRHGVLSVSNRNTHFHASFRGHCWWGKAPIEL